jgi:rubrerythrin
VQDVLLANGAADEREAGELANEIQTRNPDVRDLAAYLAGMAERGNLAPAVAKMRGDRAATARADRSRHGERCHRCAARYTGSVCPQCGAPREDTP